MSGAPENTVGDFTANRRMVLLSAIAIPIGLIATLASWALLRLIAFFTNVFYFGRFSFGPASPANNHLGWLAVLVPVLGGLIVGFIARYGSDRIRGHGMPEALESVLLHGSRVQPRLAVLKPVASAIAIGSGGPFGAEGPIIMTGGAFGSIFAQLLHLTSAERKTLLVAGAAAGMSATFAAPVASVLLAVELLLFEWKPRSAVPVALASATAALARRYLLGFGPVFPVHEHAIVLGAGGILGCVVTGCGAALLSIALSKGMYAMEDVFHRLPIHWMWWPALGGLFIGLGGMIYPQALGVGYEVIGSMLQGDVPGGVLLGVLLVKPAIWIVSLGSGTSGGVLAPLLMMGAALGGVEAMFLPHMGPGFWPLVSMAAVLAGSMGAPLTGIVFALELTHDIDILLPLLIAGMISYGIAVLVLKRSILTEKIARRGYHLSREYSIDPLEILLAREVMRTDLVALPAKTRAADIGKILPHKPARGQHLYPVVDEGKCLVGVITRRHLGKFAEGAGNSRLRDLAKEPVTAWSDEPLRIVASRMAETGLTRLPVLSRDTGALAGMISLHDLLRGRARNLSDERHRERVLRLRIPGAGLKVTLPAELP